MLSLKDIYVNLTADTARKQRICLLSSVDYLMQFKLYTKYSILISTVLYNKLFTFTMLPLPPPLNFAVFSPLSFLTSLRIYTNSPKLFNSVTLVKLFLISSFRRVLYVVRFLLGNYPASGFSMPTFRNTLSVPSS